MHLLILEPLVTATEFCKDKFKICLTALYEKSDTLLFFNNYVLVSSYQ